ncbi:ATP-NAD kinase [Alicyclobacillaceae bacterium I2511]|nr:ATP-NAD kinase [Alicyclobacillaceae bacterium I2511]
MKKTLGLIVNPVAGMGGRVGLKGSDGVEILERARELGAKPESPLRTTETLKVLTGLRNEVEIVTYPGEMGENEAREAGFEPQVIGTIEEGKTTSLDTIHAAREMADLKVELLLFAGGDGTARNIYDAIGGELPTLGIPAGVKIHSAVYATNPHNAGELVKLVLQGNRIDVHEAEVMDIDEDGFREGRVTAKLYGYLQVPYDKRYVQSLKSGRGVGEEVALSGIAEHIIEAMEEHVDYLYIIGPGTTTRTILEKLGVQNTLLGVDVLCNKQVVANDVTETQLLNLLENKKAKIVITVIGGQGYIFGRGNQQISPRVIKKIGVDNIMIIATKNKVISLKGNPFLVDTGDSETNKKLSGYVRVTTGYHEQMIYRVDS